MEFTIQKDVFLKALQRVQGIVEKRNTMPILSNVLVEAAADRIELTATDLEVGMKCSYPATVVREGRITVSAKKLYEIIKELPDKEIHFTTKENDWVEIRCGKAHFNIVGLSSAEFPYFPKVNEYKFVKINSNILNEMIEKTAFAICHDETKYNLNGIFIKSLETNGTTLLKMVATDGHRLAITEKELDGEVSEELNKGVIFPKKGIFEIKKLSEEGNSELLLGFLDNSAVIKKGDMTVVMRLVDGEFPDYTRVVPANNDKSITINRDDFLHCLKRMAILSSEKYKGIKLELRSGSMEISSSNPEVGDAREEIEVNYAGDTVIIRFNARYLIDVLSVLQEDEIKLNIKDDLSPAILKPALAKDFLSVIMPMRL